MDSVTFFIIQHKFNFTQKRYLKTSLNSHASWNLNLSLWFSVREEPNYILYIRGWKNNQSNDVTDQILLHIRPEFSYLKTGAAVFFYWTTICQIICLRYLQRTRTASMNALAFYSWHFDLCLKFIFKSTNHVFVEWYQIYIWI